MGTEIKIRQNRKKLDISQIEALWKKACKRAFGGETDPRIGTVDDYDMMPLAFISSEQRYKKEKAQLWNNKKDFLLFDNNNYGSGIGLWFDQENQICMKITFPTTFSEIASLYQLVNDLCEKLRVKEFSRGSVGEFQTAELSQLNWFVELGINDTLGMLERMDQRMREGQQHSTAISGVTNPIWITREHLKSWGVGLPLVDHYDNIMTVLKNYESFMHAIQSRDLFYATVRLFRITEGEQPKIKGFLSVTTDCDTILPIKPKKEYYFLRNQYDTKQIDEIDVLVPDRAGKTVKIEYQSFLREIAYETREAYDGEHFILRLSREEMDGLIDRINGGASKV